MITRLTNRLYSIIVQDHLPAVWMEMVFYRVITIDARCMPPFAEAKDALASGRLDALNAILARL